MNIENAVLFRVENNCTEYVYTITKRESNYVCEVDLNGEKLYLFATCKTLARALLSLFEQIAIDEEDCFNHVITLSDGSKSYKEDFSTVEHILNSAKRYANETEEYLTRFE